MLTDRYKEILETLSRNKTRSFLTGFGVFWGVFMLVSLIGGGEGLREILSRNFEGFANNAAIIWAQPTTKPYEGLRKGRAWAMTNKDIERLRQQVPSLQIVTGTLNEWGKTAVCGKEKTTCVLKGLEPNYTRVETPQLFYGRYLNEMDLQQSRKVCVIGKKVYKSLFPAGGNPCGRRIRVGEIYFQVVGVDYGGGEININGRAEESVCVPITLMQRAYAKGDSLHMACLTAQPGVKVSTLIPQARAVIARSHRIDPTDERAISSFNMEVLFSMVDNLFHGINLLAWMVGIGTLLAGAIGVSNIMMVTVKERTTEIGIRRAIGATPHQILGQIISESILLTAVAGMSGLLFSVGVLQLAELASITDGIVTAHFQVDFWTALGATGALSLLGVLAGLAPALRAMDIKPIDAMREE